MNDLIGLVVYSKSGRDKGKAMIIIDVVNDNYCLVADGDSRPIERPKLKNIKHIQLTNIPAQDIMQYFEIGKVPENHVIRKSLNKIKGLGEPDGKEGC